ncbi:MAG: hypothetical protein KTR35_08030 [Gammaproteobacteria bacterium]|nr:hypothetical protein [Gammaproteobacteria bacterium]
MSSQASPLPPSGPSAVAGTEVPLSLSLVVSPVSLGVGVVLGVGDPPVPGLEPGPEYMGAGLGVGLGLGDPPVPGLDPGPE